MNDNIKLPVEITEKAHNVLKKPKPVASETRRLCGDVPASLFTEFKVEVVKSGLTMAQAVEQAVRLWLEKQHEEAQNLIERAKEEAKQLAREGA